MLNGAARLAVGILATLSTSIAAAAIQPAVTFDFPHTSGCGPNNVEGWQFQTTASVTVSALGVYDSSNGPGPVTTGDGLNFSIPVGLYDSECTQLAAVTVPAGTVAALINDYRYVGIAPVVLAAGQTYRVGAVMHCNDFTPQFQTPTGFALDPSVTAVETRRLAFESMLACPTQTSVVLGFAPNFLIGPPCGNGVVQDGEQCDDGNVADGDCCSATCQYETDGSPCPADGEACTDDVCNAVGVCTHEPTPSGTPCRPAASECDAAESCDGISPSCPPDGSQPNGTPCTDDGLFCSGSETCQDGACTSSGNPCAVGVCDEDANQCVAPSATATASSTSTASVTATQASTATGSPVSTPTRTQAATQTGSPPSTATRTPSATPTGSPASTATRTPSATPTGSQASTSTPTGTQINSPTRTAGPSATATSSALATITPSPTPTSTSGPVACVGDCDGSGDVTIGELITGVNIAIGTLSIDRCPAFDASENGDVEINELIAAVGNALNGCP